MKEREREGRERKRERERERERERVRVRESERERERVLTSAYQRQPAYSYHIFKDKSEVGCCVDDIMKSYNIRVFQSFQK